jgi:outer membrane protein insertion porin family
MKRLNIEHLYNTAMNSKISNNIFPLLIKVTIILIILFVISNKLLAKNMTLQGYDINFEGIIREIQIKGLINVDKEEIINNLNSQNKIGFKAQSGSIAKDINTIYLGGYFYKVSAYTEPTKNGVVLIYKVNENPKIKSIQIKGNSIFSDIYIQQNIKNKSGNIMNMKYLREDQEKITNLYHEKGYNLFKFHNIDFDKNGTLIFNVSEGEITDIHIEGLKTLTPDIILRDLHLQPKRIFNSNLLNEDREKLLRKGYFSDVYFPGLTESIDKRKVSIAYKVTEKKVNLLDLGLEQEDEYQGRVVGFLRGDINHIFQQTDVLAGKTQFSLDENSLEIISYSGRYTQPWLLNMVPVSFSFGFWDEYRHEFLTIDRSRTELHKITRLGTDVVLGFPLIRDRLMLLTRYKAEKVVPPSQLSPYTISSLAGILSYQSISNWNNPKRGTYWKLEIEKGGNLGVINLRGLDFSRVNIKYATFFQLSKASVLGFHNYMGIFRSSHENINTFDAEGYEIGGAASLRGYKEEYAFIGSRKIAFNLEYRHDLTDAFQGVLFLDAGKVFETGWSFSPSSFTLSKGFGFRFFTPIGAVRTDFSFGEAFIIHFGLGQMF